MTAQRPDVLLYQGERMMLYSNPLEDRFSESRPRPQFVSQSTADWRGYLATWEIEAGRLFLVGLEAKVRREDAQGGLETVPFSLEDLFPGCGGRVLADWFSGDLMVPRGKLLQYVHMGYSSVYEQTLWIKLEQGRVVSENAVTNSPPGSFMDGLKNFVASQTPPAPAPGGSEEGPVTPDKPG